MTPRPAQARRFRVALSFPGEYRNRVQKIAELLGNVLTRDKVLYDHWHSEELNRPNLGVYLPRSLSENSSTRLEEAGRG